MLTAAERHTLIAWLDAKVAGFEKKKFESENINDGLTATQCLVKSVAYRMVAFDLRREDILEMGVASQMPEHNPSIKPGPQDVGADNGG